MRGVPRSGLDHEEDFRRLFAEHNRQVLAYALRRCEQRADAEDVVAGTFAVAWRRFADAPDGGAPARVALRDRGAGAREPAALAAAARGAAVAAAGSSGSRRTRKGSSRTCWRRSSSCGGTIRTSCASPRGRGLRRGARCRARLLRERGGDSPPPGAQATRGAARRKKSPLPDIQWLEALDDRERCDEASGGGEPGSSRGRPASRGARGLDPRPTSASEPPSRACRAVVVLAAAASLTGVFVFGGQGKRSGVEMQSDLPGPTVQRPLAGKQISLADGTAAIGPALVLPDTSLVGPSDAGPVWMSNIDPKTAVNVP